jgi:hypothetical protein
MAKSFALILGIVLLAIGLWGMASGGHDHELVVFGINATHNLVHLLSGALAVGSALAGPQAARMYLLVFGAVYGLVALLGFAGLPALVRLLNLNGADNWLHAGIAAACLWVGAKSAAR